MADSDWAASESSGGGEAGPWPSTTEAAQRRMADFEGFVLRVAEPCNQVFGLVEGN